MTQVADLDVNGYRLLDGIRALYCLSFSVNDYRCDLPCMWWTMWLFCTCLSASYHGTASGKSQLVNYRVKKTNCTGSRSESRWAVFIFYLLGIIILRDNWAWLMSIIYNILKETLSEATGLLQPTVRNRIFLLLEGLGCTLLQFSLTCRNSTVQIPFRVIWPEVGTV